MPCAAGGALNSGGTFGVSFCRLVATAVERIHPRCRRGKPVRPIWRRNSYHRCDTRHRPEHNRHFAAATDFAYPSRDGDKMMIAPTKMAAVKNIAVLGSTGSIGTSALEVIAASEGRLRAIALSAHRRLDQLVEPGPSIPAALGRSPPIEAAADDSAGTACPREPN